MIGIFLSIHHFYFPSITIQRLRLEACSILIGACEDTILSSWDGIIIILMVRQLDISAIWLPLLLRRPCNVAFGVCYILYLAKFERFDRRRCLEAVAIIFWEVQVFHLWWRGASICCKPVISHAIALIVINIAHIRKMNNNYIEFLK